MLHAEKREGPGLESIETCTAPQCVTYIITMDNMWMACMTISISLLAQFIYSGVACSQSGRIQLTQSGSINLPNAGRVEICMGGVWGTIAADSIATPWSEKNAQVACIELGFSAALSGIFQRM